MELGLNWDLEHAVDPSFGARLAAALQSEGLEGLGDVMTPGVTWHISGGSLAGAYEGLPAVIELLLGLRARGITFSLFDTLVSDAHCGMLLTFDGETDGHKTSAYGMWLMHVDNGVAGECFWYFEDQAAFEALIAYGPDA